MIDNQVKLLIAFAILFFLNSCNLFFESEFEKEQNIINAYHKKVLEEDGKLFFFIPKKDISLLFPNLDTISKCNSKKNNLVLFFDNNGNINYQCQIFSINNECNINIICLDFETGEYYITDLSKKNIRGFKSDEFSHFIIVSED